MDTLPWRISNDLASWYAVAASSDVPEGGVRAIHLGSRELVLFRSKGKLAALDPHCAHMGAKLCQGKVVDGHLSCPLHAWKYDHQGQVQGLKNSLRSWPVVEAMGAILVFNGPTPLYEPPSSPGDFHWASVKPADIDAPWFALTANAFDTHHYEAVHRRRLLEEPEIRQEGSHVFHCSYLSEVTGAQLSDRLMQSLAKDGIGVTMSCYGGTLFTVHSKLGEHRAGLLVGMEPRKDDSTRLHLFVGSQGRGVKALLARYLYTAFLKSDLEPMTGVRLQPHTGLAVDETISRFANYLESLPEAD